MGTEVVVDGVDRSVRRHVFAQGTVFGAKHPGGKMGRAPGSGDPERARGVVHRDAVRVVEGQRPFEVGIDGEGAVPRVDVSRTAPPGVIGRRNVRQPKAERTADRQRHLVEIRRADDRRVVGQDPPAPRPERFEDILLSDTQGQCVGRTLRKQKGRAVRCKAVPVRDGDLFIEAVHIQADADRVIQVRGGRIGEAERNGPVRVRHRRKDARIGVEIPLGGAPRQVVPVRRIARIHPLADLVPVGEGIAVRITAKRVCAVDEQLLHRAQGVEVGIEPRREAEEPGGAGAGRQERGRDAEVHGGRRGEVRETRHLVRQVRPVPEGEIRRKGRLNPPAGRGNAREGRVRIRPGHADRVLRRRVDIRRNGEVV